MIAGGPPHRVHASAIWTQAGVDKTVAATLDFRSGLIAQISCSFETSPHRNATIAGTKGIIQTEYLNHTPATAAFVIKRDYSSETLDQTVQAPGINGFLAEAESFADVVQHGPAAWNGVTNQESIDILVTLEAILLSARTGKPVEIN
jgi:xylose dehydrogenase (NAD/NADP)